MAVTDPTQRFSSRVENYVRYRPGYPPAVIELLKNECGITSDAVIADVASGTGIFTRMLLENGNRRVGVEPNAEMRKAGEEFLVAYPHFTSVEGTAESHDPCGSQHRRGHCRPSGALVRSSEGPA